MTSHLSKGPRFIAQRDSFRCGPIAYLNLLKWWGFEATSRDLPKLTTLFGCTRYHGTPTENFARVIGHEPKQYTYKCFKQAVEQGLVAVILIRHPRLKESWHYCLVVGLGCCQKRYGFIVINSARIHDDTVTLYSWPYMKWLLQYSQVWFFPGEHHDKPTCTIKSPTWQKSYLKQAFKKRKPR